ncbi:retrovirus-related Pol polyprotein from transposon 17.6 [Trichonephila clavipes]|nr:retrovirus-related Pol polyprotein from transposon 17.6 [Trichonephila clavipes]
MTSPILKQADQSKLFTICTEASNYALGAVLLQESGPDEHVIEYASPLMIQADHLLARWALNIQSFNLKIDYTSGKANVVADMMSRPSYTEGTASAVYLPESDEEAQLVVPAQERERILLKNTMMPLVIMV